MRHPCVNRHTRMRHHVCVEAHEWGMCQQHCDSHPLVTEEGSQRESVCVCVWGCNLCCRRSGPSMHCNTLLHTATHCKTLQHTATTATHCNTLQHTATYEWVMSFTWQWVAEWPDIWKVSIFWKVCTFWKVSLLLNTTLSNLCGYPEFLKNSDLIQCIAQQAELTSEKSVCCSTHCNTLQHTATHCNTLKSRLAAQYTPSHHCGPEFFEKFWKVYLRLDLLDPITVLQTCWRNSTYW